VLGSRSGAVEVLRGFLHVRPREPAHAPAAALFCLILFRNELDLRTLAALSLVASLATTNRMDSILLFLPRSPPPVSSAKLEGSCGRRARFVPFALWEAFALVYYGFLFPNSAYAKLITGVSRMDLVRQG
jgi:arabinofuranosyltransferase